jgi:hypothetical protein
MSPTYFETECSCLGRRLCMQLRYGTVYMHRHRQSGTQECVRYNYNQLILALEVFAFLGQPILPTCKGQQSKNCLKLDWFTVEEGVYRLPRNVANQLPTLCPVTSKKSAGLNYTAVENWNLELSKILHLVHKPCSETQIFYQCIIWCFSDRAS